MDCRGIIPIADDKNSLENQLKETLHGICRAPALMIQTPTSTASELGLEYYEIMQCEPLHDITNVVANLISDLPKHIDDKTIKSELDKFTTKSIGDKNQLKGSDARRLAIKLAMYTEELFNVNKISEKVHQMVASLVEIIHIAYSPEEKRCPREILRLFNLCFTFGHLYKSIMSKVKSQEETTKQQKGLTQRKLFGNHFHSTVCHLPETYRIINTKSVLTEDEERSFGLLRRISEMTSNRRPGDIIDNAVLRFNCQEQSDERLDSLRQQESDIGRLGKLLPKRDRSKFNKSFLMERSTLFQAHLSRIPEFLAPGKGVWWHFEDNHIVFHDSSDDPKFQDEGPPLLNFRSSSLKEAFDKNQEIWQNCIEKFKCKTLSLPLYKLKLRNDGKLKIIESNACEGKMIK